MTFEKIFRGMADGPEAIDKNFIDTQNQLDSKKSLVGVEPNGTILWQGTALLGLGNNITLSKSLWSGENGVLFLFCPYINNEALGRLYCTFFFPKARYGFSGQTESVPLVNAHSGILTYKVLKLLNDTTVEGQEGNTNATTGTMVLRAVLAV